MLREQLAPQLSAEQARDMDTAIRACVEMKMGFTQLVAECERLRDVNRTLLRDLEDLEEGYNELLVNDYL